MEIEKKILPQKKIVQEMYVAINNGWMLYAQEMSDSWKVATGAIAARNTFNQGTNRLPETIDQQMYHNIAGWYDGCMDVMEFIKTMRFSYFSDFKIAKAYSLLTAEKASLHSRKEMAYRISCYKGYQLAWNKLEELIKKHMKEAENEKLDT